MVLLISYDLNGHECPSCYGAVRRLIESRATASRRPLYSQWWVETNDSGVPVHHSDYEGLLSDADWKWLEARL